MSLDDICDIYGDIFTNEEKQYESIIIKIFNINTDITNINVNNYDLNDSNVLNIIGLYFYKEINDFNNI
jgi:hypothetical protein